MHVAACAVFEGPRARLRRADRDDRLAAAPGPPLPPAARVRAARPGPPGVGRRPAFQRSPTTSATPRCRAPAATPSSSGSRGRVFSQALDRARPLWELWLVEGLADDRFALLSKTHHALVDGISGVDIADGPVRHGPGPGRSRRPSTPWAPRPLPTDAQLLADALLERRPFRPRSRAASGPLRGPRRVARAGRRRARRARRDGLGRAAAGATEPAQRQDRAAPPVHLGARRSGSSSRRQERARWDRQRRRAGRRRRRARPLPATPRPADRRSRPEGDGAGLGPQRTSSAAHSATASRRCGRRCRSG